MALVLPLFRISKMVKSIRMYNKLMKLFKEGALLSYFIGEKGD